MPDMLTHLQLLIANKLKRQSIDTCSKWASNYRIMGPPFPGPICFDKHHAWTKAMRDCNGDWVGPKSAQMGYTEVCLDRTFFLMDVKGYSVLYLLPKRTPDAADFSRTRFNKALELSPHIESMFSATNNVGLKQAGPANLYIRGTQTKSGVKSVDVSLVVFDEYDEMNADNIPQAEERMSGQLYKQKIKISTPTIPEHGIDVDFKTSTQEHFFFKCPKCGRMAELTFPNCLIITADSVADTKNLMKSHIICSECKRPLEHERKDEWLSLKNTEWVPTANKDSLTRGFYINQLYSPTRAPWEIAVKGILGRTDVAEETEFYNSKGGMPYIPAGSKITDDQIASCLGSHHSDDPIPVNKNMITMGVDQGKWLHYEIDLWLDGGRVCKVLNFGKVLEFEQLDLLMRQFQVQQCVIDANPERRNAFQFANRFFGHVHMCFYSNGVSGKNLIVRDDESTVSVDRTSWLDLSLGRFKTNSIILPRNTDLEYKNHIKAQVRHIQKDTNGNPVARYINIGDDHYGHARNYAEIALAVAVPLAENRNIGSVL